MGTFMGARRQIRSQMTLSGTSFLVSFIILSGVLSGCATRYGAEGGIRTGFSDHLISENIYEIRVTGNNFTDGSQVRAIAFQRVAALAREHAYEFVVFKELESWSDTYLYQTSGAHKVVMTDAFFLYGEDITFPQKVSPRFAAASLMPKVGHVSKPRARLLVEFLKDESEKRLSAFHVDQIYNIYTEDKN